MDGSSDAHRSAWKTLPTVRAGDLLSASVVKSSKMLKVDKTRRRPSASKCVHMSCLREVGARLLSSHDSHLVPEKASPSLQSHLLLLLQASPPAFQRSHFTDGLGKKSSRL